MLIFASAWSEAQALHSGTTLLRNDVGAYPDRDTFRYDVQLFPAEYDATSAQIPHGTAIRLRLMLTGPTSRYQYLNLSMGEAGLELIRATSSATGRVNQCNTSAEADVLERSTNLNSANGLTGGDSLALEGFATFTSPRVPFFICYRKSVSRYRNLTLMHNSTSAWNIAHIPASWLRGTTYKDLWEPLDPTMHFAWQRPHGGGFLRAVNSSHARFDTVGANGTVAGQFGALRLLAGSNHSAPFRFKSNGDTLTGDVIKLVKAGTPCVPDVAGQTYPGTFGATSSGAFTASGVTASLVGAATTLIPIGTDAVNWLAGVHGDGDASSGLSRAVAYLRFPEQPGRYEVCLSIGSERRKWAAAGSSAESQSPGWRKLFHRTVASTSVLVVGGESVHQPRWAADSAEALSWTRIVVTGQHLRGGPALQGDAARQYTQQVGGDALRIVPASAFVSLSNAPVSGCWFRAFENITASPGDAGATASYDLREVPSNAVLYPIRPWRAPTGTSSSALAAYVRLPRIYHTSVVCYRRANEAWQALQGTLAPRAAAVNLTWSAQDLREGTTGHFHIFAPTAVLAAGLWSDYATPQPGAVWARIVAADADCQLGISFVDVNQVEGVGSDAGSGLRRVAFFAVVPSRTVSTAFRVCAKLGAGPWHSLTPSLIPTAHVAPSVTALDARGGTAAIVSVVLRTPTNVSAPRIRLLRNGSHCESSAHMVAEVPARFVCGSLDATQTGCVAAPTDASSYVTAAVPMAMLPQNAVLAGVSAVSASLAGAFVTACFRASHRANWEPLSGSPLSIKHTTPLAVAFLPGAPLNAGERVTVSLTSVAGATAINTTQGATRLRLIPSAEGVNCVSAVSLDRATDNVMSFSGDTALASDASSVILLPAVAFPTQFTICVRAPPEGVDAVAASWEPLGTVLVSPSVAVAQIQAAPLVPGANASFRVAAGTSRFSQLDRAWLEVVSGSCSGGTIAPLSRVVDWSSFMVAEGVWQLEVPLTLGSTTVHLCYSLAALNRTISLALVDRAGRSRSTLDVSAPVITSVTFEAAVTARDAPDVLLAGADSGDSHIRISGSRLDPAKDRFKLVVVSTSRPAGNDVDLENDCTAPARGSTSVSMAGNTSLVNPRVVLPLTPGRYIPCYWWHAGQAWIRASEGTIIVEASSLRANFVTGNVSIRSTTSTSVADRLNSLCGADCATFLTRVRFVNTSTACSDMSSSSFGTTTVDATVSWPDGALSNAGWFAIPTALAVGDYRVCILRAAPGSREGNRAWIAAFTGDSGIVTSRPAASLGLALSVTPGALAALNWTSRLNQVFFFSMRVDLTVNGVVNADLTVPSSTAVALSLASGEESVGAAVFSPFSTPDCRTDRFSTASTTAVAALPLRLFDGFAKIRAAVTEACNAPCVLSVAPLGVSATLPPLARWAAFAVIPLQPADANGFLFGASGNTTSSALPLHVTLVTTDAAGREVVSPSSVTAQVSFAFDYSQISQVACVSGCTSSATNQFGVRVAGGRATLSLVFTETRRFVYSGIPTTAVMTVAAMGRTSVSKLAISPATPSSLVVSRVAKLSDDLRTTSSMAGFTASSTDATTSSGSVLFLGVPMRFTVQPITLDSLPVSAAALQGDSLLVSIPGGSVARADDSSVAVTPQAATGNVFVVDIVIVSPCPTQPCALIFQSSIFRFVTTLTVFVSDVPPLVLSFPSTAAPLNCVAGTTGAPSFEATIVGKYGFPASAFNGTLSAFARSQSHEAVRAHQSNPTFPVVHGTASVDGLCTAAPCDDCVLGLVADAGAVGEIRVRSAVNNSAYRLAVSRANAVAATVPALFVARVVSSEGQAVTGILDAAVSVDASSQAGPVAVEAVDARSASAPTLSNGVSSILVTFATPCLGCVVRFSTSAGQFLVHESVNIDVLEASSPPLPTRLTLRSAVSAAAAGQTFSMSVTLGVGIDVASTTRGDYAVVCSSAPADQGPSAVNPDVFGSGGELSPSLVTVSNGAASFDVSLPAPCLACRIFCHLQGDPTVNGTLPFVSTPVATRLQVDETPPIAMHPFSGGPVAASSAPQLWNLSAYAVDSQGFWAYDYRPDACAVVAAGLGIAAFRGSLRMASTTRLALSWRSWTVAELSMGAVPTTPRPSAAEQVAVLTEGIGRFLVSATGLASFTANVTSVAATATSAGSSLEIVDCTSASVLNDAYTTRFNASAGTVYPGFRPAAGCSRRQFLVGETLVVDMGVGDSVSRLQLAANVTVTHGTWQDAWCGYPSLRAGNQLQLNGRSIQPVTLSSVCSGCRLVAAAQPCGAGTCTASSAPMTVTLPETSGSQRIAVVSSTVPADAFTLGTGYSVVLSHFFESPSGALLDSRDLPTEHVDDAPTAVATLSLRPVETDAHDMTGFLFDTSVAQRRSQSEAHTFNISGTAPTVAVQVYFLDACTACRLRLRVMVAGSLVQDSDIAVASGSPQFRVFATATGVAVTPRHSAVGAQERFAAVSRFIDAQGRPAVAQSAGTVVWSQPTFVGTNTGYCGLLQASDSASVQPTPDTSRQALGHVRLFQWTNPGEQCTVRASLGTLSPGDAMTRVFADAVRLKVTLTSSAVVELGSAIELRVEGIAADESVSTSFANSSLSATVAITRGHQNLFEPVVFDTAALVRDANAVLLRLTPSVSFPAATPTVAVRFGARNGTAVTLTGVSDETVAVTPASCSSFALIRPLPSGAMFVAATVSAEVAVTNADGAWCPLVAGSAELRSNCTWGNQTTALVNRSFVNGSVHVAFTIPMLPTPRLVPGTVVRNVLLPNCTNQSAVAVTTTTAPTSGAAVTPASSTPASSAAPESGPCWAERNETVLVPADSDATSPSCNFEFVAVVGTRLSVVQSTVASISIAVASRLQPVLRVFGLVNEQSTLEIRAENAVGALAVGFSGNVTGVVNSSTCSAEAVLLRGATMALRFYQGIARIQLQPAAPGSCSASVVYRLNSTAAPDSVFHIEASFELASAIAVSHESVVTGLPTVFAASVVSSTGSTISWLGGSTVMFSQTATSSGCGVFNTTSERLPLLDGTAATRSFQARRLPSSANTSNVSCDAAVDYASASSGETQIEASIVASIFGSLVSLPVAQKPLRVHFGFAAVEFRTSLPMGSWRIGVPFNGTFYAADRAGNTAPLPSPRVLVVGVSSDQGSLNSEEFSSTSLPLLATFSAQAVQLSAVYQGPTAQLTFQARWGALQPMVLSTYFQNVSGLRVLNSTFAENMTVGDRLNITVAVVDGRGRVVSSDNASIVTARQPFGVMLEGPLEQPAVAGVATFSWTVQTLVPLLSTVRFLLADLEVGSPTFAVLYTPAPVAFVYVPRPLALTIGRYPNASVFSSSHFVNVMNSISLLRASRNETAVSSVCEIENGGYSRCFTSATQAQEWHAAQVAMPNATVSNGTSNLTQALGVNGTAVAAPRSAGSQRWLLQSSLRGVDVRFELHPDYTSGLEALRVAEVAIEALRVALRNPSHPIHAELEPLSDLRDLSGASFPALPAPPSTQAPSTATPAPSRFPQLVVNGAPSSGVGLVLLLCAVALVGNT